jgi:hypothetical protein
MPPAIAGALVAISPEIFGAAILGTTVGAVAGSLISSIAVSAAIYGAEALLAGSHHSAQKFTIPQPPVPQEQEGQETPPRLYGYGRYKTGGYLLFRESAGQYVGYAMCVSCRPIGGVDAYIVDSETLTVSSGATTEPVLAAFGYYPQNRDFADDAIVWPSSGMKNGQYIAYIYIPTAGPSPIVTAVGPFGFLEFRNASEAGHSSTLLTTYFGSLWTADQHLGRGLAIVYSKWATMTPGYHMIHYPRYLPVHSQVLRGAKVYDPRDDAQSFLADGVYSVDNPTWTYSTNNALHIADYLTFPDGFGLAYDDIHWPSFIVAANNCDRLTPTRDGGVRPFATSHLGLTSQDERREVLKHLLAACDGALWEDEDGKVNLWIGQWIEPTVTLKDEHLSSIKIERLNGVYAASNVTIPSYIEPRLGFVRNTTPDIRDEASIGRVGERIAPLELRAVANDEQAYALGYRAQRRQNTPLKITATGPLRMLIADGERVVRIKSDLFAIDGVFRVMSLNLSGGSAVQGVFHLVTEDMFADVISPYDAINPSLPGITITNPYIPETPEAPALSSSSIGAGLAEILAVAHFDGGLSAPTNGDTSSYTRFRSRPVNVSTGAPLGSGDWTIWANYSSISLYSATSPSIAGVTGTPQRFEVQCWLVSTGGNPGNPSASSFITISTF